MLTKEDNDLLTRVGPATPMGTLFRRFWVPCLLSDELPGPDCTPVRVRILSEDLIAFRDTDGKVGLVHAYCPHRNAPMFFGRNEEGGLRCIYHGWKFDVEGKCVEMPNCWEGETFKEKVHIKAYPTEDRGGMIWAYLGPAEKKPPMPDFEWLDVAPEQRYVMKYLIGCNYLQSLENEFAESHGGFLHRNLGPATGVANQRWTSRTRPADGSIPDRRPQDPSRMNVVDTDFGSVLVTKVPTDELDKECYQVGTPYWMPFSSAAGGLSAPGVFPLNIKVPVDDEHMVFFRYKWSEQPITTSARAEMIAGGFEFPTVVPGTYTVRENKSNDYLIDRNKQRFYNYSGMANTPVQDIAMTENQGGPIADRSQETLVSTDKYIIHVRRRLMNAAKGLMNGQEPPEAWKVDAFRARVRGARVEVPAGTPLDEVVDLALHPEKAAARDGQVRITAGQLSRRIAIPAPDAATAGAR